MAEMMMYNCLMFLWVDETRCDRCKLIQDYGYGTRGIPPRDRTLRLSGKRYSVIAIMSTDGVSTLKKEMSMEIFSYILYAGASHQL